jgi:hypothetical protein
MPTVCGVSKPSAVYEVYQKVAELGQERNAGLIYSILAAISFKIMIPPIFFLSTHFNSTAVVIFLNATE